MDVVGWEIAKSTVDPVRSGVSQDVWQATAWVVAYHKTMDIEKKRTEEETPLPLALSPSTFAEATADKKGRGKGRASASDAPTGDLATARTRLPPWIRVRISGNRTFDAVHDLINECDLKTVCSGAHCPNKHECFSRGTATFMILGDTCTRDCRFCAVNTGVPAPVDEDEPHRVAVAAERLKLKHVVVTSVTRDDLPDGGARLFAATILAVRERLPGARVEVLVPDFQGRESDIDVVLAARPDVFNHNLETVRRLQRVIRPAADYERSLGVLRYVAGGGGQRAEGGRPVVKSGLMVGLGETDEEIREAILDLRRAGCELLTIGQYLAPSSGNHPVERFVTPEQFEEYAKWGVAAGFLGVASAPMVRSSYHAEEQWVVRNGEGSGFGVQEKCHAKTQRTQRGKGMGGGDLGL